MQTNTKLPNEKRYKQKCVKLYSGGLGGGGGEALRRVPFITLIKQQLTLVINPIATL